MTSAAYFCNAWRITPPLMAKTIKSKVLNKVYSPNSYWGRALMITNTVRIPLKVRISLFNRAYVFLGPMDFRIRIKKVSKIVYFVSPKVNFSTSICVSLETVSLCNILFLISISFLSVNLNPTPKKIMIRSNSIFDLP